jgi:general stress protein YciG
MPGTKIGGLKASAKNRERYGKDFYAKIGRKGGKNGTGCGIISIMHNLRDIGVNPLYKVSDKGIIIGKTGRPMKPQFDKKGYLRVQIKNPNKHNGVTTLKVHRVVAEHFIENKNNLPQVDHIDGDKSNNCVDNLEWVTNEENMRRAVARGAFEARRPKNLESLGGQILTAIEDGYVGKDLFELNGVERKTFWKYVESGFITPTTIVDIKTGRKNKHYYFDKSRGKWRVERSDGKTGRQFDTEDEAIEYSKKDIGGGFFANRELAREAGRKGGKKSVRKPAIELKWGK